MASRDSAWAAAHRAEIQYGVQLRKIARYIGDIVKAFNPTSQEQLQEMQAALRKYGNTLEPWAKATAKRMIWDVARRNENAWVKLSRTMGEGLREVMKSTPIGSTVETLMFQQVELIKSLPVEAALRVQQLSIDSLAEGSRGTNIIREILKTGEVTKSRATLIARTETSRASSVLIQARSEHIGSTQYTWRSSRDALVRPTHKKMEGRICEWANPPEVEPGKRYHAGCIYNCRCIPEPILPARYL